MCPSFFLLKTNLFPISFIRFTRIFWIFIFFAGVGVESIAQPAYTWAKRMGVTVDNRGNSIAIDSDGNVYTTGYFRGTVDFDPDPVGTYTLSSAGIQDIFVDKTDAAGNLIWAKAMGGTSRDIGYSIAVDDDGNVLVGGYFMGTADFNPDAIGTFTLGPAGGQDNFVCKLDISGNFVWAKQMSGSQGTYVAVDKNKNVFSVEMLDGYNVSSVNKLDAAGVLLWTKNFIGGTIVNAFAVATDDSGNVYTTGDFQDMADFDPGAGAYNLNTNGGSLDAFVSKLNTSGSFVWAKQMGGLPGDAIIPYSITVDDSGNGVYTTGRYTNNTVDFDPGLGTYNLSITSGVEDIFVSKLDTSGNFVWAKGMGGGAGFDQGNSIALSSSGNLYITGFFRDTVDFNPDPVGTYTLFSAGGLQDIFVVELSSSGNFVCAGSMGGTGNEAGTGIAVDDCGNLYTTGYFGGTVDFDPEAGINTMTASSTSNIFVSKLAPGSCSKKLPQPVIIPTGPTTFYSCKNVVLDAGSGFLTYQWLPGSTTTQTITVTTAGNYSVAVSDVCGSNTSSGILVTVNPQPTISLTLSSTLCSGSTQVLSTLVEPPDFYALVWSPSTGLSSTTGSSVNAGPIAGSITYTVSGSDGAGCYDNQTVSLAVIPLPTLAGANQSICYGNDVSLTITGGAAYTWSPVSNLSSSTGGTVVLLQAPAGEHTYTITGYEGSPSSCSNTHTLTVTVHELPIVNAGTDQYICLNDPATLIAIGTAGNYTWSPGTYFTTNTGALVTASFPAVDDTYTCSVILQDSNNCSAGDTVLIHVVAALIANAGQDITISCGTNTTLTGTGGLIFAWSPAMGLNPTSSNMPVFDPTAIGMLPGIYTYSLVVASGIGCVSAPDAITITVDSIRANAGADQSICSGSTASIEGTGGNTYTWAPQTGLSSTNTNSSAFSQTAPGAYTYYLTVSNGTGCTSQPDAITITVIAVPTVSAGADITIRPDQSDTLHAAGNAQSYSWIPDACSNCLNPVVFLSATTPYILTAGNAFCTATDTVIAHYVPYPCDIYIPNAFSPNNDGENDIVKVHSHCLKEEGFVFRIFDRWGTLVFETYEQDKSWDGIYEGHEKNTAVFVYQLQAATINLDNISKKGNISLMR